MVTMEQHSISNGRLSTEAAEILRAQFPEHDTFQQIVDGASFVTQALQRIDQIKLAPGTNAAFLLALYCLSHPDSGLVSLFNEELHQSPSKFHAELRRLQKTPVFVELNDFIRTLPMFTLFDLETTDTHTE